MLMAQQAATPSAPDALVSPPALDDSVPPITVQIEPPPISISSSMIGVAGPLGAQSIEGKPFLAEFVTEHHQDFTDGNRITRTTASTIYRDAQGRIRRESQLSVPGLPAGIASATFITIVDRRLGCGWVLNPQEMVAHRYRLSGQGPSQEPSYVARLNAQAGGHQLTRDTKDANSAAGNSAALAGSRHWQAHAFSRHMRLSQENANSPAAMSAASGESGAAAHPAAAQAEESDFAPAMRIDQPFLATPNPVRTENLGEQMILGVRSHGTRVVTTLPAGEIGNDLPIDIVSEQWFSPDLELVMRSMHRDPWGGEFTTTVTRIRRGEQRSDLFAIPSKYKVIDAETEGEHHILETHGSHTPGTAPW
jgi:hypothetical protein